MSDELTRVTAALDALGDEATPEQISEVAHLYSKRDVAAAMFSLSGGGGSVQPSLIQGMTFSLTSEEVIAASAEPFELVPAPGPDKLLILVSASLSYTFGTTAYSTGVVNVLLGDNQYGGATLLDQEESAVTALAPGGIGLSPVGPRAELVNQPLVLQTALGGPITAYTLMDGGGSYAVSDTGFLDQQGNQTAEYVVDTVSGGAITAFTITDAGRNYIVGSNAGFVPGGAQPGSGDGNAFIQPTAIGPPEDPGDGTLAGIAYYFVADVL